MLRLDETDDERVGAPATGAAAAAAAEHEEEEDRAEAGSLRPSRALSAASRFYYLRLMAQPGRSRDEPIRAKFNPLTPPDEAQQPSPPPLPEVFSSSLSPPPTLS